MIKFWLFGMKICKTGVESHRFHIGNKGALFIFPEFQEKPQIRQHSN